MRKFAARVAMALCLVIILLSVFIATVRLWLTIQGV